MDEYSMGVARRALAQMVKLSIAWMPGMVCVDEHDRRWTVVEHDGRLAFTNGPRVMDMTANGVPTHADGDGVPDLAHLGTLGCIEHGMLPVAWPDHEIEVHRHPWGHEVFVRTIDGDCEWSSGWVPGGAVGETLVACMEAAPR